MSIRTILQLRRSGGQISVRLAGSKLVRGFDSVAHLRTLIREAITRDEEHQTLLAIARYMRTTDSTLATPQALEGTTIDVMDPD